MDKSKRTLVAQKGGQNAINRHKWTKEEARAAGIKGSMVRWNKKSEQRTLEDEEKQA